MGGGAGAENEITRETGQGLVADGTGQGAGRGQAEFPPGAQGAEACLARPGQSPARWEPGSVLVSRRAAQVCVWPRAAPGTQAVTGHPLGPQC